MCGPSFGAGAIRRQALSRAPAESTRSDGLACHILWSHSSRGWAWVIGGSSSGCAVRGQGPLGGLVRMRCRSDLRRCAGRELSLVSNRDMRAQEVVVGKLKGLLWGVLDL